MKQRLWKYLLWQIIPSCVNSIFDTFDPTRKDALQLNPGIRFTISVIASRRSISSGISRPIRALVLSQIGRSPAERCPRNKVHVRAPSVGGARKSLESSLSCGRVHCQCVPPASFALHSIQPGRICQAKGPSFYSLTIVHWMKLPDRIVAIWHPLGFHKTVNMLFLDTRVLFSASGAFSSRALHIRSRTSS
jgi:hypothetical protein